MAINKKDAQEKQLNRSEEELNRWETVIDSHLSLPWNTGRTTFDLDRIPAHLWRALENRYRAAGWTVTFHSSQRDGTFWVFE